MKLISNCHFYEQFKDILRTIEDEYDQQAEEKRAPTLNGSGPVEWLAEIWTTSQEFQGLIYDLWNSDDSELDYAKNNVITKAREYIVLMLNIIKNTKTITLLDN